MSASPPDANPITTEAAYASLRGESPWRHANSHYAHHRLLPTATLAPWLNDDAFLRVYSQVKAHTLVDIYRCYEIWTLALQTRQMTGDILEVGVWRGGTGAILASAVRNCPGRKVYLADTFSGVVKAGERDTQYVGGEHADTSIQVVRDLLGTLSLDNAELLQGTFPDETGDKVRGTISLLHCDVDVYSSTRDIVNWVLPRMLPGAIMVFDDYGFFGCEGVTAFCDELREQAGFRFVHNLNGHAIFIKF